eukprot:15477107-Alexandrium_andersonii.AAC.1
MAWIGPQECREDRHVARPGPRERYADRHVARLGLRERYVDAATSAALLAGPARTDASAPGPRRTPHSKGARWLASKGRRTQVLEARTGQATN